MLELLPIHLAEAGLHDQLWQLLTNEAFREQQIHHRQRYDAPLNALHAGILLYSRRASTTTDDDARLCWLTLRSARLRSQAQHAVLGIFESVRGTFLDDPDRIVAALARLEPLGVVDYYFAAIMLLWIECNRQLSRTDRRADPTGVLAVLAAVTRRLRAEREAVNWGVVLDAPGFLGPLALLLLRMVSHDAVVTLFTGPPVTDGRTPTIRLGSNTKGLVEAMCHGLRQEDTQLRLKAIRLALALVAGIDDDFVKGQAVEDVVTAAVEAGLLAEGIKCLDELRDDSLQSSFLAIATRVLIRRNQHGVAHDLALRIPDVGSRCRCLLDIADDLARPGETRTALRVLSSAIDAAGLMPPSSEHLDCVVDLAEWLGKHNKPRLSRQLLDKSLSMLDHLHTHRSRGPACLRIAEAFGQLGDRRARKDLLARALTECQAIKDSKVRADSLQRVSQAFADARLRRWAARATESSIDAAIEITDIHDAGLCLQRAAEQLANCGCLRQSLAACRRIQDESLLTLTFKAIANRFRKPPAATHRRCFLKMLHQAYRQSNNPEAKHDLLVLIQMTKADRATTAGSSGVAEPAWLKVRNSVPLIRALAKKGQIDEALALARKVTRRTSGDNNAHGGDEGDLVMLLTSLGGSCPRPEANERAERVWVEAQSLALHIADSGKRDRALRHLALARGAVDDFDGAIAVAEHIPPHGAMPSDLGGVLRVIATGPELIHRSVVLQDLVELALKQNRLEDAVRTCRLVSHPAERVSASRSVVSALLETGQLDRATDLANDLGDPIERRRLKCLIAGRLVRDMHIQQAFALLEDDLCIEPAPDAILPDKLALLGVATELACQGHLAAALEVLARTTDTFIDPVRLRESHLSTVARAVAERGQAEDSITLACGLPAGERRDTTFQTIATELARRGMSKQSLAAAGHIVSREDRAHTLNDVANELARQGCQAEALAVARRIEGRRYPFVYLRDDVLKQLVRGALDAGDLARAQTLLGHIRDRWCRAWALHSMAEAFVRARRIDDAWPFLHDALATARAIKDQGQQFRILYHFFNTLVNVIARPSERVLELVVDSNDVADNPKSTRNADLAERCQLCCDPSHAISCLSAFTRLPEMRAWGLAKIAKALAVSGRAAMGEALLVQAASLVDTIAERDERMIATATIAAAWCEAGQPEQGITFAERTEDPEGRAVALANIARRLARQGQLSAADDLYTRSETCGEHGESDLGSKAVADRFEEHLHVLMEAGESSRLQRCLGRLTIALSRLDGRRVRHSRCRQFAALLAKGTRYTEARHIMEQGVDPDERPYALTKVVESLCESNHFRQAVGLCGCYSEAPSVAWCMEHIAESMSRRSVVDPEDLNTFGRTMESIATDVHTRSQIRAYWHKSVFHAGRNALQLLREGILHDATCSISAANAARYLYACLVRQSEWAKAERIHEICPQLGLPSLEAGSRQLVAAPRRTRPTASSRH